MNKTLTYKKPTQNDWIKLIMSYPTQKPKPIKRSKTISNTTKESDIKKILRLGFIKSPERKLALRKSNVVYGKYKCNCCKLLFKKKDTHVHHINGVANNIDWNDYISKLFCDVSQLEVLCVPCHKDKHK